MRVFLGKFPFPFFFFLRSVTLDTCDSLVITATKNMGNDIKTIAEEKFTLKQEIKIVAPIESTRDSNSTIEKYEICYIMKKEINNGSK